MGEAPPPGTAAAWRDSRLPLHPPYPPMEAARSERLPHGDWQFEPKWDGFRLILFREDDDVYLQSKAGQPLARYFPEIVLAARQLPQASVVLDGELVIEREGRPSFDDLLVRVHPAESRVRRLSQETPASFYVFALLALGEQNLARLPLRERRARLERLYQEGMPAGFKLSPATHDETLAKQWFAEFARLGLEGIMAKRLESSYASGKRDAMLKIKRLRTADCVVGGVRYQEGKKDRVGALLLGLYGNDGLLNHVGMCSSIAERERPRLNELLEPLKGGSGFTGKAPGGPSRWTHGRSMAYVPLKPELVCEVRYDYFTQGRFRHGTKFLRWRPEKAPETCTYEQVVG